MPKTEGGKTMIRKRKKTLMLKVFVVLLSLAMTTAGFSTNGGPARIIPSGTVSVIQDGQVVSQFSQETPLPEGVLLRCEDKCTINLGDTYMVVDPGTEFSVSQGANSTALYVKTGTVYFAINEASNPIQITTPSGDATTGDLTMTDNEVRGYVRVTGNETEIGVIGGGTMMVETTSGEMAITPGNAVTTAAIGPETTGAAAGEPQGLTRNQWIGIGVASAVLITAGVIALSSGGGGGGGGRKKDDGSPASP